MIRYLVYRPIGTCVIALALSVLGVISGRLLPISLLPDIPVPEITIEASYPNADAAQIQQIVAVPLRNQLLQLNHLEDIEMVSENEKAIVKLRFDYGSDIDLAYLEANEKIDMLMQRMPREMQRPIVIKAGAGDIPVFNLNVQYKTDTGNFLELSRLCEDVLKKRLEQSSEIAMVDVAGLANAEIVVRPNLRYLQSVGLDLDDFLQLMASQSETIENTTVKDGPYEYSIRFHSGFNSIDDIRNLHLTLGDQFVSSMSRRVIRLGDVASVSTEEGKQIGLYTFDGNRAVSMAVIKQADSQIFKLREEVHSIISAFEKEYPGLIFALNQDQTSLLDVSISNLVSSILAGAGLSFLMIFFFIADKRAAILIGIVIPVSLCVTMLGFYLFKVSINIVSLAGLLLGIGEIVDSAIIIIENIEQHLATADSNDKGAISRSCITGSAEVIGPLFTSVLTNSAVFIPLLFLSGIAGTLFYDQAIAVSLALGVSLLTSYTLVPVLYAFLHRNRTDFAIRSTIAAQFVEGLYDRAFSFAFRSPKIATALWLGLLFIGVNQVFNIPKAGMPRVSRIELEVDIDWNEPVSIEESNRRIQSIIETCRTKANSISVFVGHQQYLLGTRFRKTSGEATLVLKVDSDAAFNKMANELTTSVSKYYPAASIKCNPAINVFEQLFETNAPSLEIQLSESHSNKALNILQADSVVAILRKKNISVQTPPRLEQLILTPREDKLVLYDVDKFDLTKELKAIFGRYNLGALPTGGQLMPIILGDNQESHGALSALSTRLIQNKHGDLVPLGEFLEVTREEQYSKLYLGKNGSYVPIAASHNKLPISQQIDIISPLLDKSEKISAVFSGNYFKNLRYIAELKEIILIAVVVLYFILAAQFESLLQPLIVLVTVLFGLSGALAFLYVTGGSFNIMSAIGMIVLIGLLDNDSILKIDTMNRSVDKGSATQAIHEAGRRRLQSQVMTYLTTILGLAPVIWASGLGAELQTPLAVAVIGGMTIGVFNSWTFIPLTYFWLHKIQRKRPR